MDFELSEIGIYLVAVVSTAIFSAIQLKRLADPSVSPLVFGVTWCAWLTSLSVVALVPLDVFFTLSDRKETKLVEILWEISYWSTQVG